MGRSVSERAVLLRGLMPPARPVGLPRPELSASPYSASPYSASPCSASPHDSPVVARRARPPKQEHRISDLEAEIAAKARLVEEFTTELDLTTTELLRTQAELPKQEHRISDLEAEVAAKARMVDEFTTELDMTTMELLRTQAELQRLKSRREQQDTAVVQHGGTWRWCMPKHSPERSSRAIRRTYGFL